MAQTTSYEIDNDSGAAVRARLNDVFAAVQSSNSGPTPPADTAPGMLWLDTSGSPSVLFRRNAADSDWVRVVPEIASQAEAEAGADNTRLMTPLRTAEAIAELSPAPSELTETQATDDTSTVFGTVSGQRLEQQTNSAFNVSGAAPKYACRAWVNFDGDSGSGNTIRASGNVSSVSRTATGEFTVNFATSLPDSNYAVQLSTGSVEGGFGVGVIVTLATGSMSFVQNRIDNVSFRANSPIQNVAIFR